VIHLNGASTVIATVKAAALLPEIPNQAIQDTPLNKQPYWDVERARIGNTREVPVEIVVNGKAVAHQNLLADGAVRDLKFEVAVTESSWIAVRILPAAHTNPIFAMVDNKPVRASRRSAQWCLDAVDQCWSQKAPRIAAAELDAAKKAYDQARQVYRQRLAECPRD
jgi:hypothetical protein